MAATLFTATNDAGNMELWITDGSGGRATLVTEIAPGTLGSGPSNYEVGTGTPLPFAVLNGFAYFSANDGVNGTELWRTDGTAGGTTRITDFAGETMGMPNGFNPSNIVVANNQLFFLGTGPGGQNGVFRSDGTAAGTTFVSATDFPSQFMASGNRVYWTNEPGNFSQLVTSDGTTTTVIASGNPGANLISLDGGLGYYATSNSLSFINGTTVTAVTGGAVLGTANHINVNGTLFYTTQGGNALYKANGATGALVNNIGLDFASSVPSFVAFGDKLIFSNTNLATGTELWISDGTNAGTVLLKDLVTGTTNGLQDSGNPQSLVKVGDVVFFQASDGSGGVDLWKTDGTTAGTVVVKHILSGNPGPNGTQPAPLLVNMTESNGLLMFGAEDGVSGSELWRSDGTATGTFMVSEINPTTGAFGSFDSSLPFSSATLAGTTFFTGASLTGGYEIWSTNGNEGATQQFMDINPGHLNSLAGNFTLAGSQIFFSADNGVNGKELWVTNGTAAGTHLVLDINTGSDSGLATFFNSAFITAFGNSVLFSADDGTNGQELWISDGTMGGTSMLADMNPGSSGGIPNGSFPAGFVTAGGKAYFFANTAANGYELWVTDGTASGTHIAKDIMSGANSSNASNLVAFGNKIAFTADDGVRGTEIWLSDGAASGTDILRDVNPGAGLSSNPNSLVVASNKLFFTANDGGANGQQVWVSDGTLAGTAPLTNVSNFQLSNLVAAGSNVFFTGFTAAAGQELYVTNGGAPTLLNLAAGNIGSNPFNLTAVGNRVFFQATGLASDGAELWVSDGTGLGTHLVKNINTTANQGSNPTNFVAIGNKLFFVADDGVNGQELWVSDGTNGGTHLVKNINETAGQGSSVFNLKAVAGGRVLFLANDGVNGQEEWISDGTSAGTFRVTDLIQPNSSGVGGFVTLPTILGDGSETLNGTIHDDQINGLGGADTINGLAGNDILNGGTGIDTMTGGDGNDIYFVDAIGDEVFEANGAGTGIDTVRTYVSYSVVSQFVENVVLLGNGSINAVANNLNNTITGNSGNNTINGRSGVDSMTGGNGNDTYFVDAIGDQVFEANGVGTGIDTVRTYVGYSVVSQFVENVELLGSGSINAIGNNLANTITGNAGNNAIDGRGGIDVMEGGLGNDTYYVDNVLDKTIEANVAGTDTVYTTVSKAFVDQFVEVIRLSGSGNINTTGNSLANTIVGNGANNGMNGREGADTLTGGYGNDTFVFNTALGATNIDTITDFKPVDDTIQLDNAIFTTLGLGVLAAGAFRTNVTGAAQDADDRIIYESDSGRVWYDSNGNAAGGNFLFADLAGGLALTNNDFLVT